MHWLDDALAFEKFHKEKVTEKGKYENFGKIDKRGWSMRDSAKAFGISSGKASHDIQIVKFFRLNPKLVRTLLKRGECLQLIKEHGLVKVGGD